MNKIYSQYLLLEPTVDRIEADGDVYETVKVVREFTIPQGTEEIGEKAFFKCKNLRKTPYPREFTQFAKRLLKPAASLKKSLYRVALPKLKRALSMTEKD